MPQTADKCSFCDNPQLRERVIFQDELIMVFPTNIPIVPGHVLISPLQHIGAYDQLSQAERDAITAAVARLKPVLSELFGATGFNFAWNEGPVAGQSVPHFHLHMLPRKAGDAGITEYEPRQFLYRPGSREASPEAELQEIARLVGEALKKQN